MVFWFGWFLVFAGLFFADYMRSRLLLSRYSETIFYDLMVVAAIIFAGLRYRVGNDYDSYVYQYGLIADNPLLTYMEPGFAWVCWLLNKAGLSAQGMFFLFSGATLWLMGNTIKKYSPHPAASFMIFLLIPAYYFNLLCIVRQFFAISIVFAALPFVIRRKFLKFFLLVVLAATFHKSALLAIPIYFLAVTRLNKLVWLGLLALVILIPPATFVSNLGFLGDYDEYLASEAPKFGLGLTVFFRVCVFVFVVVSWADGEDTADRVIRNLYLIGVIVYFATLSTEAMSRISLYFTVFEVLTIIKTFYLYKRTDRVRMSLVYVLYCTLLFFQNLASYSTYYQKGTSEGNINYEVNLKMLR